MSTDAITLRLPRERPFFGVAYLVVGGLAARLDLGLEKLQDLQVAVAELLEQQETEEEITVAVSVENGTIRALLGPFDETLERELARDPGDTVGLLRILETVVDDVQVKPRDGSPWVELTMSLP
jgi:anti-sigma regulatory factor (Ser/Thr protein kinase)